MSGRASARSRFRTCKDARSPRTQANPRRRYLANAAILLYCDPFALIEDEWLRWMEFTPETCDPREPDELWRNKADVQAGARASCRSLGVWSGSSMCRRYYERMFAFNTNGWPKDRLNKPFNPVLRTSSNLAPRVALGQLTG